MITSKRYCDCCRRLSWHTRWQASRTTLRALRWIGLPTIGLAWVVLLCIRAIEHRAPWRCKLCGDTESSAFRSNRLGNDGGGCDDAISPAGKETGSEHHLDRTDSKLQLWGDRTRTANLNAVADELRRQRILADKPPWGNQRAYWEWHDQLYLGGSWKSLDWQERAREAKQRDNWQCQVCGSTEDLHTDHILALSKGGSNELDNLQTLCHLCHENKTGRKLKLPERKS
jgi:hypothetical protein